jgi:hypothetical protein
MYKRLITVLALVAGCDGSLGGAGPDGGPADAGSLPDAAASALSAGMAEVDFGCVVTGQPFAYRVQVANPTTSMVGPLSASLTPSTSMLLILNDGCSGLTLATNEACLVSIFFMATTPVEVEATLEVDAELSSPPLRLPVRARSASTCP